MSKIRTCATCGNKYEYCPNCSKYEKQPKWRFVWDTEECKDVYNIVFGYKTHDIEKEQVYELIKKYNITDTSMYIKEIQEILKEFLPNGDVDIDFNNDEVNVKSE